MASPKDLFSESGEVGASTMARAARPWETMAGTLVKPKIAGKWMFMCPNIFKYGIYI